MPLPRCNGVKRSSRAFILSATLAYMHLCPVSELDPPAWLLVLLAKSLPCEDIKICKLVYLLSEKWKNLPRWCTPLSSPTRPGTNLERRTVPRWCAPWSSYTSTWNNVLCRVSEVQSTPKTATGGSASHKPPSHTYPIRLRQWMVGYINKLLNHGLPYVCSVNLNQCWVGRVLSKKLLYL